ncbi:MAG: helix-turn-helix transcriptional regulator [Actinomycetota bacterium]|nr:helix-turn-helix transcriptional regulator [Actinomycetota bacterium]
MSASRARLAPDDVGIDEGLGRRRVPGLRREEIAMLAGVSSSYYTRLEQGQALHASTQVIDALSRALQLSEVERDHLHALARGSQGLPVALEPAEEVVDETLLELVESLGATPAMVFGRRRDILAWNATGHALFAGHLEFDEVRDPSRRPNATQLVFLDAHTRELYVDWDEKALASVGHLRLLAAKYPDDARLLALLGRLTVNSSEFAEMWASNRVRPSNSATYRMRHPLVGSLSVTQQLLTAAQAPGQTVVICTAPAGSSSSEALGLLAHAASEQESRRP